MQWDLIGDIGGTNMRLAAAADGALIDTHVFPTKGGGPLCDAIATVTAAMGSVPRRAVVAGAGPIHDPEHERVITLTNSGLRIDEAEIAGLTSGRAARVLNDFEAAAWSQVTIDPARIRTLHGAAKFPTAPRLILGPGTGLGVGSIVWHGDMPVVIPGEGGHVRVAAETDRDLAILRSYARLFPEFVIGGGVALEAEALASGTGIPNLYAAIAATDGQAVSPPPTPDIFAEARNGEAIATETVARFCATIARVAGDLALFLNARGGVFLCGGMAAANPWAFETPDVIDAFCQGGRFTAMRRDYNLHLVTDGAFGLDGALNYLCHVLGDG